MLGISNSDNTYNNILTTLTRDELTAAINELRGLARRISPDASRLLIEGIAAIAPSAIRDAKGSDIKASDAKANHGGMHIAAQKFRATDNLLSGTRYYREVENILRGGTVGGKDRTSERDIDGLIAAVQAWGQRPHESNSAAEAKVVAAGASMPAAAAAATIRNFGMSTAMTPEEEDNIYYGGSTPPNTQSLLSPTSAAPAGQFGSPAHAGAAAASAVGAANSSASASNAAAQTSAAPATAPAATDQTAASATARLTHG